jgi:hypothetical protein
MMEESKDVEMHDETAINTSSLQNYSRINIGVTRDPFTQQVLHNGHVIPALKSSNINTIIFSIAYKLPEAIQTLRQLSRNGYQFADSNRKHLEEFCTNDMIS